MNVRGILLDLDDTLYEYEKTHKIALITALKSVEDKHKIESDVVASAFRFAKKKLKSILPNVAANHSRILYFQLMFEHLNINPIPNAYEVSELYWQTFLENMELTEDSKYFLDKYKDLPICLLTDLTAEIQYRKLDKLSLTGAIDHIVTSEEAGVEKPHPFMFKRALAKLRLSSDEVVMIGDNYAKDIEGAALLGIKSFWVTRQEVAKQQILSGCIRVNSLTEVVLK
ncbi:HAD family hydrolase [Vibrio coralliilyticus]|uniref:HAD family hydrolase n=1 Tax=Vibrio coralliilyticus TaxID=190893 RepID=UPI00148DA78E|nr:HAD family hydrolase [Vibrio coralliilyticus]NOI30705.1 HAD family hydrolase [Vibrio coralliilyticus]NOI49747.1 HAD family hydrolase [Vibrio coralliilyticus]WFB48021.1 HAD family hydrolase [Vibrio coralliilyticus]